MDSEPAQTSHPMEFPIQFSEPDYADWHEYKYPEDAPLLDKINTFRDDLKQSSRTRLDILGQLLAQIASRTESEFRYSTKGLLTGNFNVPVEQLKATSPSYDLLFKSTSSIVDKMWRKNNAGGQERSPLTLANLKTKMTDLVRTSVVAPTLYHAEEFAKRTNQWRDILSLDEVNATFAEINRIDVDREAKPTSGYFAYHMLVWFQDGFCVEVQVYSQLTSAWRNVSHKLYEQTRLGAALEDYPGSPNALFVSLGHALHLIDWQLKQIVQELKDQV